MQILFIRCVQIYNCFCATTIRLDRFCFVCFPICAKWIIQPSGVKLLVWLDFLIEEAGQEAPLPRLHHSAAHFFVLLVDQIGEDNEPILRGYIGKVVHIAGLHHLVVFEPHIQEADHVEALGSVLHLDEI